ncbi:mitochondrial 54S ribosomal protein rml2 [Microbotryomycetes sp. JL221]|nr:mitochondrial 54S ribosomal protein rml2 [Microbotryomycetes sp. JL221]
MATQLTHTARVTLSTASCSTSTAVKRSLTTSSRRLKPATSPTTTVQTAKGEMKQHRVLTFIKKTGQSNFKTFLPVTPSLRQLRQPMSEHLWKGEPHRPLTVAKRSSGGRNNTGRITVRARGGGHKRRIRLVDFHRKEAGEQVVERIEYDPGRSAHIALLKNKDTGLLSYILAPATLRAGDIVQSFRSGIPASFTVEPTMSDSADPAAPQTVLPPTSSLPGMRPTRPLEQATPKTKARLSSSALDNIDLGTLRSVAIKPGNCLPLRLIPVGTIIHAITLSPEGPAILARSAGSSARIISATSASGKHAQVRLSSGEVRLVGLDCIASIGEVSNPDHQHRNYGKAGRMRWLGFRPQSRGVAMNATDHPHGGGRGKSKGNNHPRDKWGNGAKGQRTRPPHSKNGNKMVVKSRKEASQRR